MTDANSNLNEFAGKRILVTGATGSIGRAVAIKLLQHGAHVVLNGREASKLDELIASNLPSFNFSLAPFDINNTDDIPSWLTKLAENGGAFAGIAHIAGTHAVRPLRSLSADFIQKTLHTNVTTGIMLGKAYRQRACHIKGSSFVLVGSMCAHIGGAGQVAYAASKGAVTAATKAMAHELLRDDIRVNCVVPATISSDMSSRARENIPAESWQALVASHPLGLGSTDDVAHAIIYLLSDRSRWMTGTEFMLDGGLSIA